MTFDLPAGRADRAPREAWSSGACQYPPPPTTLTSHPHTFPLSHVSPPHAHLPTLTCVTPTRTPSHSHMCHPHTHTFPPSHVSPPHAHLPTLTCVTPTRTPSHPHMCHPHTHTFPPSHVSPPHAHLPTVTGCYWSAWCLRRQRSLWRCCEHHSFPPSPLTPHPSPLTPD